ncbi:MAG: ABC transporter ATP-binding protein [Tabrizicola sp.]|jgi:spermidine/putrescine transport system ATP-binding protein|nr:ABC transporter ATP-binding protein [Tabrizicola sp.]
MPDLLTIAAARRAFTTPEGKTFQALDGIDLTVGDGEFVTLLGPSGCGKTTLLRAIAGFEQIDSGSITLDGRDLTRLAPHQRPVNTVFQSYALFPHMTVARNVGYALEVRGMARSDRERWVADALDKVGLGDLGTRKPSQLSGGQRQRVALARAIVAEPRLLLLDEPLSALDRNLRQAMQIELKDLQHRLGIAFVFVTHDQEEALTMSDRIVVMRSGRIEQAGAPRDIFRRPATRFVAEFIGETNLFAGRVQNGTLVTDAGQRIDLPAGTPEGLATAVLRPTDFALGTSGIPGRVTRAVYLGADLHLHVAPDSGGPDIGVVARDAANAPRNGDRVTLAYDPASVHVMAGVA